MSSNNTLAELQSHHGQHHDVKLPCTHREPDHLGSDFVLWVSSCGILAGLCDVGCIESSSVGLILCLPCMFDLHPSLSFIYYMKYGPRNLLETVH